MPGNARFADLEALWKKQPQLAKTADVVYATLRTAISSGVLPEGEQLKEEPLAKALGVSRTPVRESLQRLAVEQFVLRVPSRGVVVCRITSRQITEFYMLRVAVDGIASALAARKRTPVDVARLRWLNARMREAARSGDVAGVTQVNIEFHEAVCRIADNSLLLSFVEQIHVWVRRADYNPFTIPGRPGQGATEHDRIIDAIEAGDHDLAEVLTRQHMQASHALRLRLLGDAAA
ncbi:MAG: GntR family transcriptional regulator [Burkholderiales bacterium]|nr:GntR family transcriptional regulator [Burkholderiales bacterium]